MLHDLQYFVGTSIAGFSPRYVLIIVQAVRFGPRVNGSSLSGLGRGCKFRGSIYSPVSNLPFVCGKKPTPGSVTDAWMKDDTQI